MRLLKTSDFKTVVSCPFHTAEASPVMFGCDSLASSTTNAPFKPHGIGARHVLQILALEEELL